MSTKRLQAIQRLPVEAMIGGVLMPREEESLMALTDATPYHNQPDPTITLLTAELTSLGQVYTSHNPHNLRPCTALSRLNDGSRASYRDIHHPKYHNMIRDLISQGSQLTQTLQDFLRDIEFMLKSDSEEMDWDHTDQKEVVRDGTSREEWEAIKPEVKNPFDRLMVEKVQITLTMHERMDEG
ncbi:hypothetical protein MMC27_006756 [Xylographa pallens]|nr:hypothetical protein [Xylographa pallens]